MEVGGKRNAPVGWAPRQEWTGAENLTPTGIRSPDRSARSESLYRLRYPDPQCVVWISERPSISYITLTLRLPN
jgi:hypothetical protein